ncbi:peroxidase family protein [Terrabacter sp. BE26]|uniref:peroxidase family protein n=1 Tax=Terrabacter sp. BE26 TaxID=2898152 RepID=UPI0035BE856E
MIAVSAALVLQTGVASTAGPAPVGAGFTVTAGDLSFILKQINIAERHAATRTTAQPCGTLLNKPGDGIPDAEQVPDILTSYGLRTVDGSCNNLVGGRETFAASGVPFYRMVAPEFRDAETVPGPFASPARPAGSSTSYKQKTTGNVVFDSEPRTVSNLIVDQTASNPAAVAAAGSPVRSQGNTGVFPCDPGGDPGPADPNGTPDDCVPAGETLSIPNVTTDVGLSPPFNGLFTIFGQFFDHGVDQTVKGGGTVFVPLKDDDPLVLGKDGILDTSDDLPAQLRFMVLTRGQNQPGADKILGTADDIQDADNTDTPLVDQSQTYTSNPSHQAFLREYELVGGRPVDTGRLLGGPSTANGLRGDDLLKGGMATWATVKWQAEHVLGLRLRDSDVTDVPMLAMDPYGNFLRGPLRGLPQYVTASGLVEGDLAAPVEPPVDVDHFHVPFLTDIAHDADPSGGKVPDSDTVAGTQLDGQAAGTYDDELLDAHFCAGDGRVNENIALTAVHQVFHSEHDRLVGYIEGVLDQPDNETLRDAYQRVDGPSGWGYGQRLFQAARFVTEMEYQHLVFEEFGRKVQPAIDPFHLYHSDLDPTIPAEFAHAVYRFGHSMLTETIDRTAPVNGPDGKPLHYDVSLLDGFLNPAEFNRDQVGATVTSEAAAGGILMGMSDQTGQEIDEFVTDTLRSNLLGLPLDLATLNLTRARSEGIPSLNEVRRRVFASTNDGQMTPYTSWADLGFNLKHPESLVNFVAAYGRHPSITGASGYKAKRDAARAIVDPRLSDPTTTPPVVGDVTPDDAADFLNATGTWDGRDTGLDSVDLWVGGLAEATDINGGLLGRTFNYVFETAMTDLQNGDRFYYLARTPGMNLRTQLESNSFAELVMRNTDNTHTLKQDAFATADCKFQLANLAGTPAGYTSFGATVADDPSTDCNENKLLVRAPNGQISYRLTNTVDPAGINGQSVYNGTVGVDRIKGGIDNDTILGNDGDDVLDGNSGDDVVLGGDGADRITDAGGADVIKGGPGNDVADAGNGIDIMMGGDGKDYLNGGANDNEEFGGPGDDFIIGGLGADTVFGDGGDDWIQGGSGQDLLIGDHAAPFFDDPAESSPGHDVFVGQVGENDYDAEGGDDIMAQNSFVDRNAGAGGFDWAIHQYDTVGADDDLSINNNLGPLPIQVVVNRDRWQEVEADSGSERDDVIRGNDDVPGTIGGGGFTGCNALDAAGVARIAGLGDLVTTLPRPLAGVVAGSAAGSCPLTGNVWAEGNILLGGGGSDTITGRGADDIIDGDRWLGVRISVRANADGTGAEIGSTDLLERPYLAGSSKTLQAALLDGSVDVGQLVVKREIRPAPAGDTGTDTAVFLAPFDAYTIAPQANGSVVVTQTGPVNAGVQKASDGVDTLWNIEQLRFTNADGSVQTVAIAAPPAPAAPTAALTGTAGQARVTFAAPAPGAATAAVTSFDVRALDGATEAQLVTGVGPTATSAVVTGLTAGRTYAFQVRARNVFGVGEWSPSSAALTLPGAPSEPTGVVGTAGNGQVALTWVAPTSTGGSALTGYVVQVITGTTVVRQVTLTGTATSTTITGLANGTAYTFRVAAINGAGPGVLSAPSAAVTPRTVPGAPTGVAGTRGNAQVALRWVAPVSNGGSAITGYTVQVITGTTVQRTVTLTGTATSTTITGLTNGTAYTFRVAARNVAGQGAFSTTSAAVTPASAPTAAPGGVVATSGAVNGAITASVRWNGLGAASNGGSAVTGYRIQVFRVGGTAPGLVSTITVGAAARTATLTGVVARNTNVRFAVAAINAVGTGPASPVSNTVVAR